MTLKGFSSRSKLQNLTEKELKVYSNLMIANRKFQKTQISCMLFYGIRKDLKVSHFQSSLASSVINVFPALRSFTLESGQEEIERRHRRRKERNADRSDLSECRRGSADSIRSPSPSHPRAPALDDVPEEAFAIGDDEDEDTDNDHCPTPAASTPSEAPSRASSVSSSVDDTVPTQLRGMSEKARGKMPGKFLA